MPSILLPHTPFPASTRRRRPQTGRRRTAAALLSLLFVAGAAAARTAPPAAPLAIDTRAQLVIQDPARDKPLQLRITWPTPAGNYPVILFSHGAWASKDDYQPIVQHWAANGYVCIQVNHEDSLSFGGQRSMDVFAKWATRPQDISAIIDQLADIARRVDGLGNRMDAERIGVAGHSFGGQTTQLIGGYGRGRAQYADPRVDALVLLAPPGGSKTDTPASWSAMTRPMLTVTGSKDASKRVGQTAEWRLDAHRNASAKEKYLLWVEDGDHHLGGIATASQGGRKVPVIPSQLNRVKGATTQFWDTYLKRDTQARAQLLAGTFGVTGGADVPAPEGSPVVPTVLETPDDVRMVDLQWRDRERRRDIPVRVFAPLAPAAQPLPAVVFSHGYGESREAFDYLGQALAQNGYIGVFLTHPGSDREHLERRGGPRGDTKNTFDPRPQDIRYVLDQMNSDQWNEQLAQSPVDTRALAVGGQCMGSTTALFMTGLQIARDDGTHYADPDPRFKAVLALGPQMPRSQMLAGSRFGKRASGLDDEGSRSLYAGSWSNINVPALVVTGSRDFEWFPAIRNDPGLLRLAYDEMGSLDKHLVEIVGAQHHAFTTSPAWYPVNARDARHHPWIAQATVQFLDAYLRDDSEALNALQRNQLNAQTDGFLQQEHGRPAPKGVRAAALPAPDLPRTRPTMGQREAQADPRRGSAGRGEGDSKRRGQARVGRNGGSGGGMGDWLARLDSDGDGYLIKDEIPSQMKRVHEFFPRLDSDGDNRLSEQEIASIAGRAGGARQREDGRDGRRTKTRTAQTPERSSNGPQARGRRGAATELAGEAVALPAAAFTARTLDNLSLQAPENSGTLTVRITYPAATLAAKRQNPGPYPVIIFSHGQRGTRNDYARLAEHWASQGYAVVLADHADSPNAPQRQSRRGFTDRPADISAIIDQLPGLMARQQNLVGKLDLARIGVGGHYLGAYATYLVAGAQRDGERADAWVDPRVKAFLMISPQGTGQGMHERSWQGIKAPMLSITGSRDYSARTSNQPQWRTEPYQYSAPGDKYLVYIEGYRSHRADGQQDLTTYSEIIGEVASSYVYHVSTDFWDAYLAGDENARQRLLDGELAQLSDGLVTMSAK